MGSLNALRRGSALTVFLVFAFLSLLMLFVLVIIDIVLQTNAFPGGFAIIVALALLFIFVQWAISPTLEPRARITLVTAPCRAAGPGRCRFPRSRSSGPFPRAAGLRTR